MHILYSILNIKLNIAYQPKMVSTWSPSRLLSCNDHDQMNKVTYDLMLQLQLTPTSELSVPESNLKSSSEVKIHVSEDLFVWGFTAKSTLCIYWAVQLTYSF